MFIFFLLGVVEVIAIIIVYRLAEKYILNPIKKRNYKISKETNVLLIEASVGPVFDYIYSIMILI